ncbi:MAG: acyltransferase [Leptospiraceae bacterium]|nr:acyltransferase [Leptospiraceae bacterium]
MSIFATDILRVIAGTFIIFNHAGWIWFAQMGTSAENPVSNLTALLNQLGKPSVLFFIYLSGMAFSSHKRFASQFKITTFYAHRLLRILPSYVLISVIGEWIYRGNFQNFAWHLLVGESIFHLYFVPLILICYLAYPFLRNISPGVLTVSIFAGILLAGHLYSCHRTGYPWLFHWQFNLLPDYGTASPEERWWLQWLEYLTFGIPVFMAGIWSAHWKTRLKTERPKTGNSSFARTEIILITTGFLFVLIDYYAKVYLMHVPSDPAGRIWRFSVVIAAALWIIAFSKMKKTESIPWLRRAARASFLVYLIHPFFIQASQMLPYVLQIPFVILFSWVTSLILQSLALHFRWLGFFLGEGDRLLGPEKA